MTRPRCITYNMASVDGRLTPAPGVTLVSGDPRWEAATAGLGDPYQWVRRVHDPEVLLEGSGSFVPGGDVVDPEAVALFPEGGTAASGAGPGSADPADPVEGEHHLPPEVVSAPGRRWFAVVDGRGRVDLQLTEWPDPDWAGWHALVLTSSAAPAEHLAILRERGIPYLVVGEQRVDLGTALELLARRLRVRTVVCTGGGRLGGALLRAGLVDEIDIDVLPIAVGGRGTPSMFDAPPLEPHEWPVALDLISAEPLPGLLRLRYAVRS